MSKGRIPSAQRPARVPEQLKKSLASLALRSSKGKALKSHRFVGVSIAGGKTDKTCAAVLEYFPEQKKVFLTRLYEKIGAENGYSADWVLHEILTTVEGPVDLIAFDVPLNLPKCMDCRLTCPGYEKCTVPQVQWMRKKDGNLSKKRQQDKIFTPYTQRPVELLLSHDLEEKFSPSHALGANSAPLTARAHFVQRRLKTKTVEVYPKLSVWRIGRALAVAKSHLRFHRHAVGGDESRGVFLKALIDRNVAFVYQQDVKTMVANHHGFEAFIGALTAYMKFRGWTEIPPKGFPKEAGWIEFPKEQIPW